MTMIEKLARAIHLSLGYDNWPAPECTQCVSAARAALEAMREPSEGMIEAGKISSHWGQPICYQNMIDAALAGK